MAKVNNNISSYMWKPNTNGYPLTKVSNTEYIEGYWRSSNTYKCICNDANRNYPVPIPSNAPNDNAFLQKLDQVIKLLDRLDIQERQQYKLLDSNYKVTYLGYSNCRLCQQICGSCEYLLKFNGILYRFPEGIVHYYQKHNVKPSNEFRNVIMNMSTVAFPLVCTFE